MSLWKKKPTFYARVTPISSSYHGWWIAVEANGLTTEVWLERLPVTARASEFYGTRNEATHAAYKMIAAVQARYDANLNPDRQPFTVE